MRSRLAGDAAASYHSGVFSVNLPLALAALGASAVLFFSAVARPLAVVALVTSAVELAMATGILQLNAPHLPFRLALALALLIPGLLSWLRSSSKPAVSAATVLSLVGILQVVAWASTRI
jgi:hypothetical protein